jgi:hypothetical protein
VYNKQELKIRQMGRIEGDEKNQPNCIELEELGGAFTHNHNSS